MPTAPLLQTILGKALLLLIFFVLVVCVKRIGAALGDWRARRRMQ